MQIRCDNKNKIYKGAVFIQFLMEGKDVKFFLYWIT
jgi:hypothetical protein